MGRGLVPKVIFPRRHAPNSGSALHAANTQGTVSLRMRGCRMLMIWEYQEGRGDAAGNCAVLNS